MIWIDSINIVMSWVGMSHDSVLPQGSWMSLITTGSLTSTRLLIPRATNKYGCSKQATFPNTVSWWMIFCLIQISLKCFLWNIINDTLVLNYLITMHWTYILLPKWSNIVIIDGQVSRNQLVNTLRLRKIATILQATFSNAFQYKTLFYLYSNLKLAAMSHHWLKQWLGGKQVMSYYLNQCRPSFMSPHGITGLQWVNQASHAIPSYCG